MSISRLLRSRPVILTRRYGSGFSNLVPLEPVVSWGETRPASGCPYICGSFPYIPGVGPLSGVGGTSEDVEDEFRTGVAGQGDASSSSPKAAAEEFPSGSNMVVGGRARRKANKPGTRPPSRGAGQRKNVLSLVSHARFPFLHYSHVLPKLKTKGSTV